MRYLLLILALAACNSNPVATDMEPFDAPPIYRQWFAEAEACSGLRGDFDAIQFYTAERITVNGNEGFGYWFDTGHAIIIRDNMVLMEWTVKHEFMHDLSNSGAHPPKYFNGACGNLGT